MLPSVQKETHPGLGGFYMNINRFDPLPRICGGYLREDHLVPFSGIKNSTYRWIQALRDRTVWKWCVHHYTPTFRTVSGTPELLSKHPLNELVSELMNEWTKALFLINLYITHIAHWTALSRPMWCFLCLEHVFSQCAPG